MRWRFILASTVLLAGPAMAEKQRGHMGGGIILEESEIKGSSIRMVQIEAVDAPAIFGESVINLRQKGEIAKAATSVEFKDDNKANSPQVKLSEPVPTGISFSAGPGEPASDGLVQSQTGPDGNVRLVTLPTQPPTTVADPVTPSGEKVTPGMLAGLATGQIDSLTVIANGGRGKRFTFNKPQRQVPG